MQCPVARSSSYIHGEVSERGGVRGALAQRAPTEEDVVRRTEEYHEPAWEASRVAMLADEVGVVSSLVS